MSTTLPPGHAFMQKAMPTDRSDLGIVRACMLSKHETAVMQAMHQLEQTDGTCMPFEHDIKQRSVSDITHEPGNLSLLVVICFCS